MAKFETYGDYSSARLAMAEKGLLTAWDSLSVFSGERARAQHDRR